MWRVISPEEALGVSNRSVHPLCPAGVSGSVASPRCQLVSNSAPFAGLSGGYVTLYPRDGVAKIIRGIITLDNKKGRELTGTLVFLIFAQFPSFQDYCDHVYSTQIMSMANPMAKPPELSGEAELVVLLSAGGHFVISHS